MSCNIDYEDLIFTICKLKRLNSTEYNTEYYIEYTEYCTALVNIILNRIERI